MVIITNKMRQKKNDTKKTFFHFFQLTYYSSIKLTFLKDQKHENMHLHACFLSGFGAIKWNPLWLIGPARVQTRCCKSGFTSVQWLPPAKWKDNSIDKIHFHHCPLILIHSFIYWIIYWWKDSRVRRANKDTHRQLTKSSLCEQSGKQACMLGFSKAATAFWLWGSTSSWEWKGCANSMQRGELCPSFRRQNSSRLPRHLWIFSGWIKKKKAGLERLHKQRFLKAWPKITLTVYNHVSCSNLLQIKLCQ